MKKTPLTKSKAYRSFISDRDKALEKLHALAQARMSEYLGAALAMIERDIYFAASKLAKQDAHFLSLGNSIKLELEKQIESYFAQIFSQVVGAIVRLRLTAYTLSRVGETEAIGRALQRDAKYRVSKQDAKASAELYGGGSVPQRVELSLNRIKRDIMDAFELSRVMQESPAETLKRVQGAFPKRKVYKSPPKLLKRPKLQEADDDLVKADTQAKHYAFGSADDETWADIVNDYQRKYIPKLRGPDADTGILKPGEDEVTYYGWEAEQILTTDFVNKVRDGQIDAARENGINDFVFIAVIDDKTDDCCLSKDGKLISELQDNGGSNADGDCEGVIPPLHFNCRCTIAPVSDDLPEAEPRTTFEDFDTWLNS